MAIRKNQAFRVLPFFSGISFVVILIAAVLLLLLYRQVAITTISDLGEVNNLAVTDATLGVWEEELREYLTAVNQLPDGDADSWRPSAALLENINRLVRKTRVARVKIYDRRGVVVFSTKTEQIGNHQDDNPGFAASIRGEVESKLIYRDTYNQFDHSTDEDNLLQSYIPVPWSSAETPIGVLEIYTDVQSLTHLVERNEGVVLVGVAFIFVGLFSVLVLAVRRATALIERQQAQLEERTHMLEVLSSRMIDAEEGEKKRIAFELQEGIAQSLAACKVQLETAVRVMAGDDPDGDREKLGHAVSSLQDVMAEVRAMAVDLRPSSLDDFGLLPTARDFCKEASATIYPDLDVAFHSELAEREVPHALKVVVYRIIKDALHNTARYGEASQVDITLSLKIGPERFVCLSIVDDGVVVDIARAMALYLPERARGLEMIRERTVLSGGSFSAERNVEYGNVITCEWPL